MSERYEFAPATALEAAMRDAAVRGRTVASFTGIELIPRNYAYSSIVYVDSAGETQRTPTGPFGHYQEYWDRVHSDERGKRRFADAERDAFGVGSRVWYMVGGEWTAGVICEGIGPDGYGGERVRCMQPGYLDMFGERLTWCYTTGVRVPGARVGLDFQWEERDGERRAAVVWCRSCGATIGKFGRSIHKSGYGYDVAWEGAKIPRGFTLTEEAGTPPLVMECTCSRSSGSHIDAREYWRRVTAVEAAGHEVWDVPKARSYQHYHCVVGTKKGTTA